MRTRGFTLLEVTVALAILGLGLVAVEDINAGAARLHEASQHLTLATLLARSKMVDLEAKLNEEGFSDFDKEIDGNFDDEKHPDIRWKAEILKPDLTKSTDQLTQLITGAIGGGASGANGSGGASASGSNPLAALLGGASLIPPGTSLPDGLSMSSPPAASGDQASNPTSAGLGGILGQAAGGLIQSQVQALVTQIQGGVREVRLTVYWMDGVKEDNFTVTTHFVVLNPTGTDISNATPTPTGQSNSSGTANSTSGSVGSVGSSSLGAGAGTLPGIQGLPLGTH